ncbi:MAG TPA: hypothetical protein VGN72_21420 [Tepidisphaeraceae bacterium]|nr:hypothetical protein [Tepidisphaeraceae bacterium]
MERTPEPTKSSDDVVGFAFLILSMVVFCYVGRDFADVVATMIFPDVARHLKHGGQIATIRVTTFTAVWWAAFLFCIGLGLIVARGLYVAWYRLMVK